MSDRDRQHRAAYRRWSRSSTRSPSSSWPLAFRWASTGSSPFAAGRAACRAPRRWRSSRSPAGAGSGPHGATSTGCATCALPAARPSPCAAGRRRSRATELDPTQRVAFFRDILGPRRARHPVRRPVHSHRRRGRSRPSGGSGRGSSCLRTPSHFDEARLTGKAPRRLAAGGRAYPLLSTGGTNE